MEPTESSSASTTTPAAPATPPAAQNVASADVATTPPAVVVMTTQADARARFLRTKQPRFELATIDGAEVALVVPAEGVRGEIQQLGIDVDKTGKVRQGNAKKRLALTVISMVHAIVVDQATGQKRPGAKVFGEADLQTLLGEPAGPDSVISLFAGPCQDFLNRTDDGALEAAKNG